MIKAYMAKLVLLALLLIGISLELYARIPLDRESMELKGEVKHLTEVDPEGNKTHYYFDREGRLTRYWFEGNVYYRNTGIGCSILREYDGSGLLLKVKVKPDNSKERLLLECSYSNGILSQEVWYNEAIGTSANYGANITKTHYDSLGMAILVEEWDSSRLTSKLACTYDTEGRKVYQESVIYDEDIFSVSTSYIYDTKGRLTTEQIEGSESSLEFQYAYNTENRLQSKQEVDSLTGEVVNKWLYQYNSAGLLQDVTVFASWGEATDQAYSYDKVGNVVSEFHDPSESSFSYEYY